MMEERYHATTQNWFHPDMSNANKNITVEAKLIGPPTYINTSYFANYKCLHYTGYDICFGAAVLSILPCHN